ncbi:hypothetical protein Nepgr_010179 [Nepenthes gracilis]|uniref:RING-type domain-containing protein n=1 Tax=Nepenthes gracilis TaxID=150966 RepID=A0AAD3XL24_NEPGR|nr:hypothetical protein Nepgr_010179 [Nepenthes gracilis]
MASVVAKASSSTCSQLCPAMSLQEKGSRNKRKFRADPPLNDSNKGLPSPQNEYEFSVEKFEITSNHGQPGACGTCGCCQDHSDALKLDLGLSGAIGSSDVVPSRPREEGEADEFQDADWSDLTENQLEELVLSNLDAIFKSAIKKIVAYGYSEEVATKAVLRSGLCYGCKDTVSNIVDNTLAYLRNGREIDPLKEHCFEDLQQLEKYLLAELVCVLREVRPFFSTGDAMWCLLICDMNVSHACAIDSDPLSSFISDGNPDGSSSTPPHLESDSRVKSTEMILPNPCKPIPITPCNHGSEPEMTMVAGAQNSTKHKNSLVLNSLTSEKEGSTSCSLSVDKPFGVTGSSKTPALEEKFLPNRKIHSNSKRESILRQKSVHLEKSYRTYAIKGASKAGKISGLGGLILDKKLKSVSDSAAVHIKSASIKISKAMGVDVSQDIGSIHLSTKSMMSSTSSAPPSFNLDALNSMSTIPQADSPSAAPVFKSQSVLPSADTELSLSLATKSNPLPMTINCTTKTHNYGFSGIPYEKSFSQWAPQGKKDELIAKLVSRLRELQNQLQEWTEWANQKVMQAARRLSKDKAELKTLRQEKEEVERLKKENQTLEENTMKKLSEMENALSKASGQVERANADVTRLEVENVALRQEMEAAKLRAAETASSCQEVSKREKKTLMKFQSWEKQKSLFQEELTVERCKLVQLQLELEQAQDLQLQLEARWKQEEKGKEEMLAQANSLRKEREQLEASAKSKDDMIRSKAETNLQRYKDDIQNLGKQISELRLKADSSKIAALKEYQAPYVSGMSNDYDDYCGTGVKRERECVMCLSEEMSVVFLPCAHQVVCSMCNELHEKQGMKDCPSCRSPIQRRICVRYARP